MNPSIAKVLVGFAGLGLVSIITPAMVSPAPAGDVSRFAEQVCYSGVVIDFEDQSRIVGAQVALSVDGRAVAAMESGNDGCFALSTELPENAKTIRLTAVVAGYERYEHKWTIDKKVRPLVLGHQFGVPVDLVRNGRQRPKNTSIKVSRIGDKGCVAEECQP